MVKVATTKAQRKLFFNLRSMKQSLKEDASTRTPSRHADSGRGRDDGAAPERQARGRARDGDAAVGRRRGPRAADRRAARKATRRSPTWPTTAASRPASSRRTGATGWPATASAQALDALDARSRRIVEERWLKVNDDSSGGMTLHELAAELRRQRRAHPPDRGRGDEEDAQDARGERSLTRPALGRRRAARKAGRVPLGGDAEAS